MGSGYLVGSNVVPQGPGCQHFHRTPQPTTVLAMFTGIPDAAFEFYERLAMDNSREFWLAHKSSYDNDVRAPIEALCAKLAPEFDEAKVFRPNRDVRFSADKSPYKTHQGAYVPAGPALGWYLEISADGFRVGAGLTMPKAPN